MIQATRLTYLPWGWLPFLFLQLFTAAAIPAAETPQPSQANGILASTDVPGGLVVHLGCGDGRWTAALREAGRYLVHGLDCDPGNVQAAREHVHSLGFYGPISIDQRRGDRLPYADNLVNLLIAEDPGQVEMTELLRVLAPNGVMLLASALGGQESGIETEKVELAGRSWWKIVKPWPREIDEWTHWLHGADGNAVGQDSVVGPPRRVQWVEGPRWQRHHELNASVMALVSAHGRVFYICDEAPATMAGLPDRWTLVARDAFNGLLLWKRPIAAWGWKTWSPREAGGRFNQPIYIPRRLVAVGDRVYVTLGFNAPLTALDAATGKTVTTYDETEFTDEIAYREGKLILSVNSAPQAPGRISERPPVTKRVMAIDSETGKILWKQGDYVGIASKSDTFERITHLSLAVGDDHVCFVEEDEIVCLDLQTGRQRWRTPRPEKTTLRGHVPYKPFNLCTLVTNEDVVLFAQPEEPYTRKTWNWGVKVLLVAMSADTGEVMWSQPCSKWGPGVKADVFVVDGLVWTHAADEHAAIGIDLHSGEIKRRFSTKAAFDETHHHRCFRNKATQRYLLTARRGIEFIDLDNEECQTHHWARGVCRYGIVPCNGLVYAPPHPCQCYIDVKLSGFYALAPARSTEYEGQSAKDKGQRTKYEGQSAKDEGQGPKDKLERGAASKRLERGPAFGAIKTAKASDVAPPIPHSAFRVPHSNEWLTYRHDNRRSGSTAADVSAQLKRAWTARIGGRVSACTAGGGQVFVASVDRHVVHALGADDGRLQWRYTAGGRVDTPPTIYRGLVLFGSADGWVYCVRASDGELAWRFRAAADERRVVAFGQLESAWPVHGTVLVESGLAYVAAGRSTHLDGGIDVYALIPESGDAMCWLPPSGEKSHGLEDVLVTDGERVYMRHLEYDLYQVDPDATGNRDGAVSPDRRAFSTAGLLDDTAFSRVGWSASGKGGKSDLLVFDDSATYAFQSRRTGGFGGWYKPASGAYRLVAYDRKLGEYRWQKTLPIRVRAMVVAGSILFVAGTPDVVDPDDPWAAVEGRGGGVLQARSAQDGSVLAEYRLDAPPIHDGMAATDGRVYISTTGGNVVCFADEGE